MPWRIEKRAKRGGRGEEERIQAKRMKWDIGEKRQMWFKEKNKLVWPAVIF